MTGSKYRKNAQKTEPVHPNFNTRTSRTSSANCLLLQHIVTSLFRLTKNGVSLSYLLT